jgi:hypothetical protein
MRAAARKCGKRPHAIPSLGLLTSPAWVTLESVSIEERRFARSWRGVSWCTRAGSSSRAASAADDETSRFFAYDAGATLVRELDSGLAPGSLAGITVGGDGKLYFVYMLSGRVIRLEPPIDAR